MSDTGEVTAGQPVFQEIAAAQRERTYAFSSLRGVVVVLTALLAARVLLNVGSAIGLVLRLRFLHDVQSGLFKAGPTLEAAARFSDSLVQVCALLGVVALFSAYVVGGVWIYRAGCNVRALGARGFETSPGWAVGWYVVPIAAWFKPFMAMSEIWRASHDPRRWKSASSPPLLAFWWASWVLTNLGGGVVGAMSRGAKEIEGLAAMSRVGLVEAAIDSAAVGLFLAVVWSITRAQSATRHVEQQVAETFN